MDYDVVNGVTSDAEECDWLDVSYSERYMDKKPQKAVKNKRKLKLNKGWKIAIVAVLCVAVLAATLFADGDFKKDVFAAVKTATSSLFGKTAQTENKINVPCNLTLVDVNEGVMTFSGGRAVLSLTDGTVSGVTENSVTVSLDDNTSIVYSDLTSVMVSVEDKISENSLLGKYDGQFVATILRDGEVVKQVVGSETQLVWNV